MSDPKVTMPSFKEIPNNNESFVMDFDINICSLKAVKRAAYDLCDIAIVEIKLKEDDKIVVTIFMKDPKNSNFNLIIQEFRGLVSDHQIRLDVEEDFRVIREIIVAQAFQPCDNLQEVIDALRNEKKL